MSRPLALFVMVFVPTVVLAQGLPSGEANREAMKKFDYLVGKWKGDATMTLGPDRKQTAKQTEDVQYRLGGTILVIEGVGRGKLPGKDEEGVMFNAFAVISYDAQKKEYGVRAYRAEGVSVDGYVKPADKGEWHEVGEMSMDGSKTWRKFFEMTVAKEKQ